MSGYPPPQQYPPQGYPPQQMQYQGGNVQPPPAQEKSRGCLYSCLAAMCCCFLCEESCECCLECLTCCC